MLRQFPSTQTIFPRKDLLAKELTSHVVYNISCKHCPASYIAKTFRQPERRFAEHDAASISIERALLIVVEVKPIELQKSFQSTSTIKIS
ncbi:unnamed protein product [Rotaria sp. Silwood2]|nr:unnamed protein product [Rotaria sp. Silwood2]CAF4171923.1 unnamed protein product [Rotaria sp. Silwood2]CAF4178556.1 unnamed protein product [Rotaria sp. Silwood2]CAF4181463.1 unnamed protein product [Rotaria sp. Silwood2]CAF4287883.1 unnamed protein product [Rotaria sp. Silwood2]